MILVKTIILASSINEGIHVTEDACKNFVTSFTEKKQPLLVYGGDSEIPVGIVDSVVYDEEKKAVIGTICLNMQFASNVKIGKAIDIVGQKRVLECTIGKISMNLGGIKHDRGTEEPTNCEI